MQTSELGKAYKMAGAIGQSQNHVLLTITLFDEKGSSKQLIISRARKGL